MVSHPFTHACARSGRVCALRAREQQMTGLSKKQKLLIYEMINKDFSDKDIARMAGVPVDVIKNFRGNKNVQKNESIKNVGAGKRDRKQGRNTGNDANGDKDPGGKPGDQNTISDPSGESTTSEGSTGNHGSGITFIGGKKNMGKKEGSEAKEEDEYQCYNCDHIQGSPFTECPKCGSSNSFD